MIGNQTGPSPGVLAPFESPIPRPGRSLPGWRGLLSWSSTSAPVALLLAAGIAFGPHGISLLSPATLALLDPVVPVALAAFGVLSGLSVSDRRPNDSRLLGIAALVAIASGLAVAGGLGGAVLAVTSPIARPFGILILAAGISAATSLTLPSADALEPRSTAKRVMELGVLLPIVAGGLTLAWFRAGSVGGAGLLVAQASGITLALAAAAWLLLTRTSSDTEGRVFAVSALLLVGGVAAALSLSALFGGLLAGIFWRYAGRHPRETIGRDVLFVQHPLFVLVLLVAGARADLSGLALALGAAYVALRLIGQLVGVAIARRIAQKHVSRGLGRSLMAPGVLGVGFALNAFSAIGADASLMLGVVVTGTIGAELVAALLPRSEAE